MIVAHASHAAVLLGDGTVLVSGGHITDQGDGRIAAFAEVYDPVTDTWTAVGEMGTARAGHSATLLLDGTVLIAGGVDPDLVPLASAELYDPDTASWTPMSSLSVPPGDHTATLLADGRVFVMGGSDPVDPGAVASPEVYDPQTRSWTRVAGPSTPRSGQTATRLVDGRVLVVGGGGEVQLAEGPAYSATTEVYDPPSGRWLGSGSMAMPRAGHSATRLPDGMVLVIGGSIGDDATARSAERYDPITGTWSRAADMPEPRTAHWARLLPNGLVLVAGGVGLGSDPPTLLSALLYDPASDAWTPTVPMAKRRTTATVLADGTVLFVGDFAGEGDRDGEVFDLYGAS
jgi:N-acetylneuraminic acid mutarotase